jgi:hypothetical protein
MRIGRRRGRGRCGSPSNAAAKGRRAERPALTRRAPLCPVGGPPAKGVR